MPKYQVREQNMSSKIFLKKILQEGVFLLIMV